MSIPKLDVVFQSIRNMLKSSEDTKIMAVKKLREIEQNKKNLWGPIYENFDALLANECTEIAPLTYRSYIGVLEHPWVVAHSDIFDLCVDVHAVNQFILCDSPSVRQSVYDQCKGFSGGKVNYQQCSVWIRKYTVANRKPDRILQQMKDKETMFKLLKRINASSNDDAIESACEVVSKSVEDLRDIFESLNT